MTGVGRPTTSQGYMVAVDTITIYSNRTCIYIYRIANTHLSNEKNLGYLLYIGDYTTQLYGDYNKPL